MKTSYSDVAYVVCLLISLICSLGGYVTPYWQVDEIPQISGVNLDIHVGLNYACTDDDPERENMTVCQMLPFFYTDGSGDTPIIFAVRSLMTMNVVLMIVSVALSMSSLTCKDWDRPGTINSTNRVISLLCSMSGICGLITFATSSAKYSSPFDVLYTGVAPKQIEPSSPYVSFFLSCSGCTLFTLVSCLDVLLPFKRRRTEYSGKETRKLRTSKEVSYIRYTERFLDPVSVSHGVNSEWTHVETCHVEIFRDLYTHQ